MKSVISAFFFWKKSTRKAQKLENKKNLPIFYGGINKLSNAENRNVLPSKLRPK